MIQSPSPSVKIQTIGRKCYLSCKGKTLLGIVNKLLKTKITQQCFALLPRVNFPANNLNFYRAYCLNVYIVSSALLLLCTHHTSLFYEKNVLFLRALVFHECAMSSFLLHKTQSSELENSILKLYLLVN